MEPWDWIVVGGGAAGYFAAVTYAEAAARSGSPSPRVLILEKSPHVLGKVKISGGGRCNLTHACSDPKILCQYYPRGSKSLIALFHRWNPNDTIEWFESRDVPLKTEPDGRVFPQSNSSQSIIDCLTHSAQAAGVTVRVSTGVKSITSLTENSIPENLASTISASDTSPTLPPRYLLTTDQGELLQSRAILLATGGTRLSAGAKLASSLGHSLVPNVPSLFAFNITDPRLHGLPGISVPHAHISAPTTKLSASGPVLITHHGLSGPAILRLSAWGAEALHQREYQFDIVINWLADTDDPTNHVATTIAKTRQTWGKRHVITRPPFDHFPKRLWKQLCAHAGVIDSDTWSHLNKQTTRQLTDELTQGRYRVTGKNINKDEFVTCGGVKLPDVNLRTMESKISPGLYFAGEILNIDGITGGFNFQNAWTTAHLAATAAETARSRQ